MSASVSNELHILQHSLGLDKHGQGNPYRNHFCTDEGCDSYKACEELTAQGLMQKRGSLGELSGGGIVFHVTDAGRDFVRQNSPPPPKLTRSQKRYLAFLNADSGLPFIEWVKQEAAMRRREFTP